MCFGATAGGLMHKHILPPQCGTHTVGCVPNIEKKHYQPSLKQVNRTYPELGTGHSHLFKTFKVEAFKHLLSF